MLLSLMRKHAKSWIIKFLIGIIAVVFIFYFGYSFKSDTGIKVAYVNGELISGVEYDKVYRNMLQALQRDYRSVWNENLIKVFDLRNRALDNIVNEKLISQEARRIGFDVTKEEVQERIMDYPAFQFNGRFDESRYRSLLQQNRMTPEDFEADIARELLREKIGQLLTTFSPVTSKDILDQYTYSKRRAKVSFVQFKPETYKDSVQVDEDKMKTFFDEHKEDYRIPEKIKIVYITIDPKKLKDEVDVTDEEIKDYYEDNISTYKEEKKVKARHILFNLGQDASEEEAGKVKEKASAVLKKAREGEDFAALAKEHSEGPTKDKGGDLGYFSKGKMVKAFEEAAFEMQKEEISDLVKSPFGYHIIKVEDIKEERTKTLEEAKAQIKKTLTDTVSVDLAHEQALTLVDQMPYEVDLSKFAEEHKVTSQQTDYFSQTQPIPKIGADRKLRESLFSLDKGDVTEVVEVQNNFHIIQVSDKKPSYIPELDEVRDDVKEDFIMHLAKIEAKSMAEKMLTKLKEGKDWEELAKENGLTPQTTKFITRTDVVPQIGYDPNFQETVFALGENKRYQESVFENPRGAFVIRWEGNEGIDQEKYQEEKAEYGRSLGLRKNQAIMADWLESLKMKANIEIVTPVDGG